MGANLESALPLGERYKQSSASDIGQWKSSHVIIVFVSSWVGTRFTIEISITPKFYENYVKLSTKSYKAIAINFYTCSRAMCKFVAI